MVQANPSGFSLWEWQYLGLGPCRAFNDVSKRSARRVRDRYALRGVLAIRITHITTLRGVSNIQVAKLCGIGEETSEDVDVRNYAYVIRIAVYRRNPLQELCQFRGCRRSGDRLCATC